MSQVETCEDRVLLSAVISGPDPTTPAVVSPVSITGTPAKDDIQISIASNDPNQVHVQVFDANGVLCAESAFFINQVQYIVVSAGDGNDVISQSTALSSYIYAGNGNDTVDGGSGYDFVSAGSGNDVVHGGAGNDHLRGGIGDDILFGESGNDYLTGQNGNDTIGGGDGNDTIYGGNGDDLLVGGWGADYIRGGYGNDNILGDNFTIISTPTPPPGVDNGDRLFGDDGADKLYGQFGDDRLDGGHDFDQDLLWGGTGADQFDQHYNKSGWFSWPEDVLKDYNPWYSDSIV